MRDKGDNSFIDLINSLHFLALKQMDGGDHRAFITPLAIDELPMIIKWEAMLKEQDAKGEGAIAINYSNSSDRWTQRELWGSEDVAILPPIQDKFDIPPEQIKSVAGIIGTDVGWRDRRLVLQSKSLAICCPKDPSEDRITRGVRTELEAATAVGISSFFWQNPKWDPEGFVASQFSPAGSMGIGATEALVQPAESLEALIQVKP